MIGLTTNSCPGTSFRFVIAPLVSPHLSPNVGHFRQDAPIPQNPLPAVRFGVGVGEKAPQAPADSHSLDWLTYLF
jgi:hypothetical protein